MLSIFIIVSLLAPLEFGLSFVVANEPNEFVEEPNLIRVHRHDLNPNTDYQSGLYDPFYHLQSQRARDIKKKRFDSQRAPKSGEVIEIDALKSDLCGSFKSGLLFDEFDNAYRCGQGRESHSKARKAKGGRRRMRGNSTRKGSKRIAGGYAIHEGEFPSFVLLRLKQKSGSNLPCSGALIHDNLVITAAHCMDDLDSGELLFGVLRDDKLVASQTQRRTLKQYCMAREYRPSEWEDNRPGLQDIALVKFEPPVHYTDWVAPICLDSMSNENSGSGACMAVGAGLTQETLEYNLAKALPVKSAACDYFPFICYSNSNKHSPFTFGKTCNGDSGGPLICSLKCPGDSKARQVLQGVLSASDGRGCKVESGRRNVYTDMYKNKFVLDKMLADCGMVKEPEPTNWWDPTTWG